MAGKIACSSSGLARLPLLNIILERVQRRYARSVLDAALQLASERGIAGFTLREVARLAQVSHNAPYHHFADKAALVTMLVIENFEMLQANLHEAYFQKVFYTNLYSPVDQLFSY